MHIYLKTFLLLIILYSIHSKLLYLSIVFRHGARYPINNMYDGKQTQANHGNLSSIGLREHYLLGSYIKSDYINSNQSKLVNQTLNPRQIQIFTLTDQTRCIQSAYAHSLGLFPFKSGESINEKIDKNLLQPPFETIFPNNLVDQQALSQYALQDGFQPVPIRYADSFFPKCNNQAQIFTRRIQKISIKLEQFQVEHAAFTEKMSRLFKLSLAQSNILGLIELYDTLVCDYYLGRAMPTQFTSQDFETLKFFHRFIFSLIFQDEPAKILNAPYVNTLLFNMQNSIKGKLGVKKLSIYSGHDINVVPLMVFYNLTSAECLKKLWNSQTVIGNCAIPIPFASNILFELHQDDQNTSSYFVKVRYNGDYFNLCGRNSTKCEFYEFYQKSKAYLMDFDKACGNLNKIAQRNTIEIAKEHLSLFKISFFKKSQSLVLSLKNIQQLIQ